MTAAPTLTLGSTCSLPDKEQQTIQHLWEAILRCDHPAKDALLEIIPGNIQRVKLLADALEAYPPIFEERVLGTRKRDLDTLVDLLGKANDANFDMFLPTRALAGRTLVMAELNLWRLFTYVCDEICTEAPGEPTPVKDQVDSWLHGCVFTLLAEDVLEHHLLVDQVIDAGSGTFGVQLRLPNSDYALPSGLRCRVRFLRNSGKS